MGIPDTLLLDLIEKVISWISWGNSDLNFVSQEFEMGDNVFDKCCSCESNLSLKSCLKYHCQKCGTLLCGKCAQDRAFLDANTTRSVRRAASFNQSCQRCSNKICPFESLIQSPESLSSRFNAEGLDDHFICVLNRNGNKSSPDHPSSVPLRCSPIRTNKNEGEDATSCFFSSSSEYLQDTFDVDSVCGSSRNEFCSFTSVGTSPTDSPSRIDFTSNRVGLNVKHEQAVLGKSAKKTDDISTSRSKGEKLPVQPEDIETNSLIWSPPLPHDIADEAEDVFLTYDDDDDDEDVGSLGASFSSDVDLDSLFLAKEKQRVNPKDPLRVMVQGHFRSLVLQLLLGQGVISDKGNFSEDWLKIITALAWRAASFIRPNTSRGGSMDPCDYVKVKCVASGNPTQSELIKGVVCTKNIKHKRMTSQYKNTRLLLLGGNLECQREPNQLASFQTLLQQENESLRSIVSKIEAHRPNVLLVEKSASSFAQDLLLAKDISLVLNVKRSLLERIARCSGAIVTPSTDQLSTARLGHCELFHLEKILEDHEPVNQFNKKPSKTLMFFEGCPRRLGCTVILRGSPRKELKKVKNVVKYAVFAAYHLLLETSFIADEGALLPKFGFQSSQATIPLMNAGSADLNLELGLQDSLCELGEVHCDDISLPDDFRYRTALSVACDENLALTSPCPSKTTHTPIEGHEQIAADGDETSTEYYSGSDGNQSILVSFSSHCILNETVCERSRLLRIKFYGPSDKPLGRYLRDDLFDKTSHCRSCKESAEAHAVCYTHPHGNLMINVRCLTAVRLPGEDDGRIWMWHRCLKCTETDGVPPATRRVVMSDAAWGLSFGKFLELSFSQHATGNRVASCGHSLQRDCLRFYGFGSMIACFRYSPISILSVHLPPSILEFGGPVEQRWIKKEASELLGKAEALYAEISAALQDITPRSLSSMPDFSDVNDLHRHMLELNDALADEKDYYKDFLHVPEEIREQDRAEVDVLEINRLRHSLLINSHNWDRRIYLLESLLRRNTIPKVQTDVESRTRIGDSKSSHSYRSLERSHDECLRKGFNSDDKELAPEHMAQDESITLKSHQTKFDPNMSMERLPSAASILSDQIDSVWSGAGQSQMNPLLLVTLDADVSEDIPVSQMDLKDSPAFRRLLSPTRVYSFDSAQRIQERMRKALPPAPNLLNLRSFHASGDYKYMLRDPVSNIHRTYSQVLPREAEKLNLGFGSSPSFTSYKSLLSDGARLMIPQDGQDDIVVAVYDDEPTSIISYALCSREYTDWINDKPNVAERVLIGSLSKLNSTSSELSTWQSFGSVDANQVRIFEDASAAITSHVTDLKSLPHLRVSFEDDSGTSGKARFTVTCYYGKQFDMLRKRCCPSKEDFTRSLSRCRRWSAQGGKSNVFFAKSYDERFIIKQVTKTELESFDEFAPQYFKYFADALTSGSPTCLAKILGIYQVAVRHTRTSRETKMDLMVMENLFFNRNITKVYDLKGSERSRYNSDTSGPNNVLLDMNLLETLRTNPIFLESKAKRRLERAVWNDTSFLASIDVMDYSLLVGVDEEEKELVLGIIDYMRQYTWDKHLETWVKASGILGGPKNASPTIVSPKQYKRRFRKAMTTYFLTVPDQWSP